MKKTARKPAPDFIVEAACPDCSSEEERWQRSLMNLAGDAVSVEAYWDREFNGQWNGFVVPSDLITLASQAAASWKQLAARLKQQKKRGGK